MFDWSDVTRRFKDLASLIETKPVFRWGIITNANPLLVQLDGDDRPLAGSPSTIIGGLAPGERVLCLVQNRRVTVTGRGGGSRQRILWHNDNGNVLTDSQTVSLSENVSEQLTGIILVWTRRAGVGQAENSNFNYTPIPKAQVDGVVANGAFGVNCLLADGNNLFRKYVYVYDNYLTGLAGNGTGGSEAQTLRWVLGY